MNRMSILLLSIMLLGFNLPSIHIENSPYTPIGAAFPLKWKTKTGMASFRTKILEEKNIIVLGSNGKSFKDYNLRDNLGGVYILNAKNGKVIRHFGNEVWGDMDVNGIISYQNRYYFGNDNEELLCTDKNGKILWRNPVSGDIEHEPVQLRINGREVIVYASEAGEVRAINPIDGKTIWTYFTPDFNGWKTGDNRNLFKVKAWLRNTSSFFTKPEILDLNRDGTKDLIYLTFDNKVYAINGKNGLLLWKYDTGISLSYILIKDDTPADPGVIIISSDYENGYMHRILRLNRLGKSSDVQLIKDDGLIGLNSIRTADNNCFFTTKDSLAILNTGNREIRYISRADYYFPGETTSRQSRNSPESLIGNRAFRYGNDSSCMIILNQYDPANWSMGTVELVSILNQKVIRRFSLESTSEMAPYIADLDGDGKLDMLLNCSDGYTYCYALENLPQ